MPFGTASAIAGLLGGMGTITPTSSEVWTQGTVTSIGLQNTEANLQPYLGNPGQSPGLSGLSWQSFPSPAELQAYMAQQGLPEPPPVETRPVAEPTPYVVLDLSEPAEIREPVVIGPALDMGE